MKKHTNNVIFNIKEMVEAGLNIGEINNQIGKVYEELVAEEVATKARVKQARKNVSEGRYTLNDLEILREALPKTPPKERPVPLPTGSSPSPYRSLTPEELQTYLLALKADCVF